MRPSTTLTRPPIAPLPYSSVAGPLSTSIWSARNGSIATPWSWLTVDTSWLPRPPDSTATRGPSMPRITGRPTPLPKNELCTPGNLPTVSPSVGALAASSRLPASTSAGWVRSSALVRSGLAVTITASSLTGWSWRLSLALPALDWGSPVAVCAAGAASGSASNNAAARRVRRGEGAEAGMGIVHLWWRGIS